MVEMPQSATPVTRIGCKVCGLFPHLAKIGSARSAGTTSQEQDRTLKLAMGYGRGECWLQGAQTGLKSTEVDMV